MHQSFGGGCFGAAACRRAEMLPRGYFFCQRLSVGKYWQSCSRYSSAVRFSALPTKPVAPFHQFVN